MFALFYSLYVAMFTGSWNLYDFTVIHNHMKAPINLIGTFLTSIFGDNQVTNLGDLFTGLPSPILCVTSFVLALITSIGIVVVATKGIKKLFTVFFYGVR